MKPVRFYWILSLVAWLPAIYGQFSCDRMTACSCEGINFSRIDITNVLEKTIADPVQDPNRPEKYDYLVDFCKGRTCENDAGVGGGRNAAVCQRQIDGQHNVSVKLGDVNQHTWQVFDNNTFTVLFANGDTPGGGGDGTRSAMLYVFVVDKTYSTNPLNQVTYMEERISGDSNEFHVYVFNVYIRSRYNPEILTSPGPHSTEPSSSFLRLFLIIFLSLVGVVGLCVLSICSVCCCLLFCQRRTRYSYSSVNSGHDQYT